MLKLIKNADLYAPQPLGRMDILIAGEKIAAIAPSLARYEGLPEVTVLDLDGAVTVPGLIDIHVHVTGGGGELGPVSRVPELQLTDLTTWGITTVLGLLGTDGVTRSQDSLLAKCRALTAEGITALCLTGAYQCPSPTLTGSVVRDIMALDPVIGVKTALSDHRSSNPSHHELIRLGSDARLGGLLSAKAGIVVCHMGSGRAGMEPIFQALAHSDIPAGIFIPTHCGRNATLIEEAARYTRMGGTADFTASEGAEADGAAAAIMAALEAGADPGGLTISSDSGGSLPRFDDQGRCIGMGVGTPAGLLAELKRLVEHHGLALDSALRFLTVNPANALGLSGIKGQLAVGADADILALDSDYTVHTLFARGRPMVQGGQPVARGMFQ